MLLLSFLSLYLHHSEQVCNESEEGNESNAHAECAISRYHILGGAIRDSNRWVAAWSLWDGVAGLQLHLARRLIHGSKTHDRGADAECTRISLLNEHCLDAGKSCSGCSLLSSDLISSLCNDVTTSVCLCLSNWLLLDVEVNDDRALVNRDDLNTVGWNVEGGSKAVDELGGSTIAEELRHGPVHANLCLD